MKPALCLSAIPFLLLASPPSTATEPSCRAWTQVDSPNVSHGGDNTFAAVAGRKADDVWAVGQYAPDSNVNITQTFTAHYDGRAWTAIPSPNIGQQANALHAVTVTDSGEAWAVGYYIDERTFTSRTLIMRWDGAQWTAASHPADPGASGVLFGVSAASASDIWAVGESQRPLDRFHTLIEHYDGRHWSIIPSPDPGATGNLLYAVLARSASSAWAVGERHDERYPDRALMMSWDGKRWSATPAPQDPAASARLYALAGDLSGALYAAGEAENDFRRMNALAETTSPGRPWSIQRLKRAGQSDNHFYGIAAAPDGTNWSVGSWFDSKKGRQFTLAEREVPGGRFEPVQSPSPSRGGDSLLGGVDVVGDDLWAVGAYDGPKAQRSLSCMPAAQCELPTGCPSFWPDSSMGHQQPRRRGGRQGCGRIHLVRGRRWMPERRQVWDDTRAQTTASTQTSR